jgi:hypothetical protein
VGALERVTPLRESNGMLEFKIESNASNERRDARGRLVSWSIVLSLFGMSVTVYAFGFLGLLNDDSNLRWLAWLSVPAILVAGITTFILLFREALRRAEREMIFVLDDNGIVRKRKGFPEVRIAFSDIETLSEELRWLVIRSTDPARKIAIPKSLEGYELIRAELTKHHALAAPVNRLSLKSIAVIAISVISWVVVLCFREVTVVIIAAAIAITLLTLGSRRLGTLLPRGSKRLLLVFYIAIVWFVAILLIYLRMVRL